MSFSNKHLLISHSLDANVCNPVIRAPTFQVEVEGGVRVNEKTEVFLTHTRHRGQNMRGPHDSRGHLLLDWNLTKRRICGSERDFSDGGRSDDLVL